MSSILKVDQLQDSGGNEIITSNGSGTITVNNQTFKNGITMADQWRLSADTNTGTNGDVTANWERVDDDYWSGIGTGMTESSGVFTFPATGLYQVTTFVLFQGAINDATTNLFIKVSTNGGGAFTTRGKISGGNRHTSADVPNQGCLPLLFNVNNTSNIQLKLETGSFESGTKLAGDTSSTETGILFVRIGDSQ